MNQLISTIRQRGQLTIPDLVREQHAWVQPGSVVTIKTTDKQIVVEPYMPQDSKTFSHKEYDWDKIWEGIRRARAIKGKNKTSLSEFIAKDRETRR